MSITVEAVYVNGILRPAQPLPLKDQEKVRITLETMEDRVRRVQETYGLIGWTGDPAILDRVALDPEFSILEAP